ncbi:hypothetical protein D3C78_1289680 [compost metagenome]
MSVVGIQFALELVAAVGVPGEGLAVVAQVLGEGFEVVGGVGQFQYARDDIGQVGFAVGVRGQRGNLLLSEILEASPTYFLADDKVVNQRSLIRQEGGLEPFVLNRREHQQKFVTNSRERNNSCNARPGVCRSANIPPPEQILRTTHPEQFLPLVQHGLQVLDKQAWQQVMQLTTP